MTEYVAFDNSIPRDEDRKTWNKAKESISRTQGQAFHDYFTALAKSAGVEKRVMVGPPMIGFAPPALSVFTDDATADKLQKASKGRVFMSKVELH